MRQVLFDFSRSGALLKFLVWKTSSNIKNYLEINLRRKKECFEKPLVLQNFVEVRRLVDDLVDFLKLSMFINVSSP